MACRKRGYLGLEPVFMCLQKNGNVSDYDSFEKTRLGEECFLEDQYFNTWVNRYHNSFFGEKREDG